MMTSTEDSPISSNAQGRRFKFGKFPLIILAVVLVKSALVMALWNALIPDLFHGPVLTYLQAAGLLVLGKLLFGHGFPQGKGRFFGPWGHHHHMSLEERLKLREALRNRWTSTKESV